MGKQKKITLKKNGRAKIMKDKLKWNNFEWQSRSKRLIGSTLNVVITTEFKKVKYELWRKMKAKLWRLTKNWCENWNNKLWLKIKEKYWKLIGKQKEITMKQNGGAKIMKDRLK